MQFQNDFTKLRFQNEYDKNAKPATIETVSTLYELLDLGPTGKFEDDGTIKLNRPEEVNNNLKEIRFRGFSSDVRADIQNIQKPELKCTMTAKVLHLPRTNEAFIDNVPPAQVKDATLTINTRDITQSQTFARDNSELLNIAEFTVPLQDTINNSIEQCYNVANEELINRLGIIDPETTNDELREASGYSYNAPKVQPIEKKGLLAYDMGTKGPYRQHVTLNNYWRESYKSDTDIGDIYSNNNLRNMFYITVEANRSQSVPTGKWYTLSLCWLHANNTEPVPTTSSLQWELGPKLENVVCFNINPVNNQLVYIKYEENAGANEFILTLNVATPILTQQIATTSQPGPINFATVPNITSYKYVRNTAINYASNLINNMGTLLLAVPQMYNSEGVIHQLIPLIDGFMHIKTGLYPEVTGEVTTYNYAGYPINSYVVGASEYLHERGIVLAYNPTDSIRETLTLGGIFVTWSGSGNTNAYYSTFRYEPTNSHPPRGTFYDFKTDYRIYMNKNAYEWFRDNLPYSNAQIKTKPLMYKNIKNFDEITKIGSSGCFSINNMCIIYKGPEDSEIKLKPRTYFDGPFKAFIDPLPGETRIRDTFDVVPLDGQDSRFVVRCLYDSKTYVSHPICNFDDCFRFLTAVATHATPLPGYDCTAFVNALLDQKNPDERINDFVMYYSTYQTGPNFNMKTINPTILYRNLSLVSLYTPIVGDTTPQYFILYAVEINDRLKSPINGYISTSAVLYTENANDVVKSYGSNLCNTTKYSYPGPIHRTPDYGETDKQVGFRLTHSPDYAKNAYRVIYDDAGNIDSVNLPVLVATDAATDQASVINEILIIFGLRIDTHPHYFSIDSQNVSFPNHKNELPNFDKQKSGAACSLSLINAPLNEMLRVYNEKIFNNLRFYLIIESQDTALRFKCSNYHTPNQLVFHLNESAMVDFKNMRTDKSISYITCKIVDSTGAVLTPDLARAIYSNVSVSLDWAYFA